MPNSRAEADDGSARSGTKLGGLDTVEQIWCCLSDIDCQGRRCQALRPGEAGAIRGSSVNGAQDESRASPTAPALILRDRRLVPDTSTLAARVSGRPAALVIRPARIALVRVARIATLGSVAHALVALASRGTRALASAA